MGAWKRQSQLPGGLAGIIHARFAAQIQHVLQRRNGQIGHRGPGQPDQIPGGVLTGAR